MQLSSKEEQLNLFNRYRYHLRYRNGSMSKGYYPTFEAAALDFCRCKYEFTGNLYDDLMDVVPVEITDGMD